MQRMRIYIVVDVCLHCSGYEFYHSSDVISADEWMWNHICHAMRYNCFIYFHVLSPRTVFIFALQLTFSVGRHVSVVYIRTRSPP